MPDPKSSASSVSVPAVVPCPSCGRTNGTPSAGGRFPCMFCGAPIEVPSRGGPAYVPPAPFTFPTTRPAGSKPPSAASSSAASHTAPAAYTPAAAPAAPPPAASSMPAPYKSPAPPAKPTDVVFPTAASIKPPVMPEAAAPHSAPVQPVRPIAAGPSSDAPPAWSNAQDGAGAGVSWERVYPWRQTHGNLAGSVVAPLIGFSVLAYILFNFIGDFSTGGSFPVVLALVILASVAGVAFAILNSLAGIFNTSALRLVDGWLQVRHSPLPWPRTTSLKAGDISSLQVNEHVQKNYRYYSFSARLVSGRQVKLLDQFKNRNTLELLGVDLRQALGL